MRIIKAILEKLTSFKNQQLTSGVRQCERLTPGTKPGIIKRHPLKT